MSECDSGVDHTEIRNRRSPEPDMKDLFEISSHLTYIVECIATDLTGETKFQLSQLIPKLERSTIEDKDKALKKIKQAFQLYKDGNYRHAAICTVTASRLLQEKLRWPEVD